MKYIRISLKCPKCGEIMYQVITKKQLKEMLIKLAGHGFPQKEGVSTIAG